MRAAVTVVAGSIALTALLFGAPSARADRKEPPSARAERLFREGRAALEEGSYTEACVKLSESQALDPGTGTLLALALCHEASQKLATAWREFGEVQAASQAAGRADRAALARQHIRAIEPRLSTLTVKVSGADGKPSPLPVDVRRDGEVLASSHWGEAMPVDGGEHAVEASAPGQKPWRTVVRLRDEGDRQVVIVPPLESDSPPPEVSTPPAMKTEDAHAPSNRTIGLIVGGAGIVALGVGAVFGVQALGDRSDAKRGCPSSPCANRDAVSQNDSAMTAAWVSDVAVALGISGIAVGAYLLLRPPPSRPAGPTSSLSLGPGGAVWRGAF